MYISKQTRAAIRDEQVLAALERASTMADLEYLVVYLYKVSDNACKLIPKLKRQITLLKKKPKRKK
jgi:hypothetical protein